MKTDAVIRHDGYKAVLSALDVVEAERFFALVKREGSDYTEWRKGLWENLTIEELSQKAMLHQKNTKAE